jgi:CBS-domain-containing membrane protein
MAGGPYGRNWEATEEDPMTRMNVRDVMTTRVAAVRENTPFKEIVRVLVEWRVSAVPVLDENDRLAGIVSEADLLTKEEYQNHTGAGLLAGRRERTVRAKATGDTAGQLMTISAITVRPETSVVEAARIMDKHAVKRLPVLDADGALVGIVSRADLLKVFLRSDDEIREEVVRDVFMRIMWADPTLFEVEVRDGVVTLSGELQQRSSVPVAVRLTRAVDGVVDVVDRLTRAVDDGGKSRGHRAIH